MEIVDRWWLGAGEVSIAFPGGLGRSLSWYPSAIDLLLEVAGRTGMKRPGEAAPPR